ncbi:IS4 family transposase, partial [Chloroflexota bacterium]
MPINRLNHIWFQRIEQMWSHLRITQRRNLTNLLFGIYMSKSVALNAIAIKIPGRAVEVSVQRRLSRFLGNPAIRVRACYDPMIKPLLKQISKNGSIRLIVDGTKVGNNHQLLMVSVAYRRRSIPVAWTWVKGSRGHSSARVQLALLSHVHSLLPAGAKVLLVGDSEFGAVNVIRQAEKWYWDYVLRQKSSHLVKLTGHDWKAFGDHIDKAGQSLWLGKGLLTQKHAHSVNLLAHWKIGEDDPWLLATNLETCPATIKAYRLRMWIEEMFGDLKGHGFDLESTRLQNFLKLSRLTFAVVLLYLWLIAFGSQIIKSGLRRLVDRNDRRDLSIFQIGLRSIERRLTNHQLFSISFHIYP